MVKELEALKPKNETSGKDMQSLLEGQHSTGFWTLQSENAIKQFFADGNLPAETVADIGKKEWLTMMALYVLENKFKERNAEWTAIADKAKLWL